MVAKPAALTQTQVYLNFGLVGTSCTIAQGTVHWTQTTMVRQQLASAASGAEPSFVATLTGLYSSEGVLGLYRGFQSAAFREMTYSSLRFGLYEPIHGSAPDIAGQGKANPVAAVLSLAMLLRHSLGREDEAVRVERAVEGILADGVFGGDLGGNATTGEIGDAIVSKLLTIS